MSCELGSKGCFLLNKYLRPQDVCWQRGHRYLKFRWQCGSLGPQVLGWRDRDPMSPAQENMLKFLISSSFKQKADAKCRTIKEMVRREVTLHNEQMEALGVPGYRVPLEDLCEGRLEGGSQANYDARKTIVSLAWQEGYPIFLWLYRNGIFQLMHEGSAYFLLQEQPQGNLAIAETWPVPGFETVGSLEKVKDCLLIRDGNEQMRTLTDKAFGDGIKVVSSRDEAYRIPLLSGINQNINVFWFCFHQPIAPAPEHLAFEVGRIISYHARLYDAHGVYIYAGSTSDSAFLDEASIFFPRPWVGGWLANLEALPGCHDAVNAFSPFFQRLYGHKIYTAVVSYNPSQRSILIVVTGRLEERARGTFQVMEADWPAIGSAVTKAFSRLANFDQVTFLNVPKRTFALRI